MTKGEQAVYYSEFRTIAEDTLKTMINLAYRDLAHDGEICDDRAHQYIYNLRERFAAFDSKFDFGAMGPADYQESDDDK